MYNEIRSAVVSYRNSTSNHNNSAVSMSGVSVVSYRNSTSNHNTAEGYDFWLTVVSYRNSTSNHNRRAFAPALKPLYLIEILHQTTTIQVSMVLLVPLYLIEILHQTTTQSTVDRNAAGCILSKFYIKPQPHDGAAV